VKFSKAPELKKLVTFIPNKKEPIHNWYYFKEGFSKQLIDILIDKFNLDNNSIVSDPFCGVGTTLLTCKQRGIKSIGFDVSPFFVFVSKVKTRDYDLEELKNFISLSLKWKFERPKKLLKYKFIRKAFSKYVLEDFVFYLSKINEIEDEYIHDFFLLALIDSVMSSSYVFKDGAFVRIIKRNVPPLKKFFKYKIKKMFKDLKKLNLKPIETRVEEGDARNLEIEDQSVDCVITSPPYLNRIEYTKIYRIEETLLGFPKTEIRSYISYRVEDIDFNLYPNFPPIAKAYFNDMSQALKEMYRVCKDKSKIAIVVGGGCFPDRVIETDRILAELAEKIGFNINNILVARNSWCTRARTIKVGEIKESIIIMEK